MGEAKNLIISIVITLGLMGIFGFFITSTLISYDTVLPAQYNRTLILMSNTTGISGEVDTIKNDVAGRVNETNSQFSLFDIGGFWFQESLATVKKIFNSLNIFGSLIDSGVSSLGDTEFSRSFQILAFILKTVVIVGIILLFISALLKWEL